MIEKEFLGLNCVELEYGDISLLAACSVGPRILSIKFNGSKNIFAELPSEHLAFSEKEQFTFYGGHRLWIAPEKPSVTYIPDDFPVQIEHDGDCTVFIQKKDNRTGFSKRITLTRTQVEDVIIVDHEISNEGDQTYTIAPWAITQFKLGGTAILPSGCIMHDDNSFLPDRSIILWPYTDLYDKRLKVNGDYIFLNTTPTAGQIKVGVSLSQQWIAYYNNSILFIKYSKSFGRDCLLDLGAAGQCYCNDKFLELETLGSIEEVKPGGVLHHREIWRVCIPPFQKITEMALQDFIKNDDDSKICQQML